MKVSISVESYDCKPSESQKAHIKWKEVDVDVFELIKYITAGHAYTAVFRHEGDVFSNKEKCNANFLYTHIVTLDLDHMTEDFEYLFGKSEFKPTFCYRTCSDSEEDHRYRFLYVFDEPIDNPELLRQLTQFFVDGLRVVPDDRSYQQSQMWFGNYNAEWLSNGQVYNLREFTSISGKLPDTQNMASLNNLKQTEGNIYYPHCDISEFSNNYIHTTYRAKLQNVTVDNDDFFKDFRKLKYKDFLEKYKDCFNINRETFIECDDKSYIDLRNEDYYEVSSKYRWNKEEDRYMIRKVPIGERHKRLFHDALMFVGANPDITLEGLVYALTEEVYRYYDNRDGEMSDWCIKGVAENVLDGTYAPDPVEKKYKVNKAYDFGRLTRWQKNGKARRDMTDDEIGNVIDPSITLEENVAKMKEMGMKHSKTRVKQFCERYSIDIKSKKDIIYNKIINIYNINNNISLRDIEKELKEEGYDISYRQISRILKKYKLHHNC